MMDFIRQTEKGEFKKIDAHFRQLKTTTNHKKHFCKIDDKLLEKWLSNCALDA